MSRRRSRSVMYLPPGPNHLLFRPPSHARRLLVTLPFPRGQLDPPVPPLLELLLEIDKLWVVPVKHEFLSVAFGGKCAPVGIYSP